MLIRKRCMRRLRDSMLMLRVASREHGTQGTLIVFSRPTTQRVFVLTTVAPNVVSRCLTCPGASTLLAVRCWLDSLIRFRSMTRPSNRARPARSLRSRRTGGCMKTRELPSRGAAIDLNFAIQTRSAAKACPSKSSRSSSAAAW